MHLGENKISPGFIKIMKKILYIDVETSGLDSKTNDILQIAGLIEINGEIKEKFNYFMQPFDYTTIEESALAINKLTVAKLKTFESPRVVYFKLIKVFDKYIDKYNKKDKFSPAGYNVNFDRDFLNQFFIKNCDKYFGSYVDYHLIDPASVLALLEYKGLIELESYKLENVCDYFGIPIKSHDAMEDITATHKLIQKLCLYLQDIEGGN